jgi:hypothetical protein
MMKWMGFIDDEMRPSTTSMDAYDSILVDQLNPSHAEAMRQLFPDPKRAVEAPRKLARLIAGDG